MVTTAQALTQFAQDYSKAVENETGNLPQVIYDETWRSACEVSDTLKGELIQWQPQPQEPCYDFSALEQALNIELHQDIKDFYSTLYSGSLFGELSGVQYELLQGWNLDDQARLSGNIIGHILMQRNLKQTHTVFIGCVINSDKMLCIDNNTGAIITEIAGQDDREILAQSVVDFMTQLRPLTSPAPEQPYQTPIEITPGLMPRLKELLRSLMGK